MHRSAKPEHRRFESDPNLQAPYRLIKASDDSPDRFFFSKTEAGEYLYKRICPDCLEDIAHSHNLHDLLSTACGCEWWFDDETGDDIF